MPVIRSASNEFNIRTILNTNSQILQYHFSLHLLQTYLWQVSQTKTFQVKRAHPCPSPDRGSHQTVEGLSQTSCSKEKHQATSGSPILLQGMLREGGRKAEVSAGDVQRYLMKTQSPSNQCSPQDCSENLAVLSPAQFSQIRRHDDLKGFPSHYRGK